jgi:hypothetical protein
MVRNEAMSDLIATSTLTEEERHAAVFSMPITESVAWHSEETERVAFAARDKALRAIVAWLDYEGIDSMGWSEAILFRSRLINIMDSAGIKGE